MDAKWPIRWADKHKNTRWGHTGYREALCPMCNSWVYTFSYEDDTRWRYSQHKKPGTGEMCEMYRELVPIGPKQDSPHAP